MTSSTRSLQNRIFCAVFAALFFALSLSASFSKAADAENADTFTAAVTAFKAGKLDEAKSAFLELESKHPADPTLLLNLGLIANKQKHAGAALALWRKGLASHPSDEGLLNAVDWIKPKLGKSEIAHDIDSWEEFRRILLARVSPFQTVLFSGVFFFFAGALLLRYWGARRRALDEELALPPAPVGGIVISILAIFLLSVSLAIFIDRLDIRGTIIASKVDVRSAPDTAATSLFEAFEGMEIIVRESRKVENENWRRVTYPGGMTGWVRDRDVLTTVDPSERAFAVTETKPAVPTTEPGEK